MDPKDIRTLKLLDAYTGKSRPTQRELARQIKVSLGHVNASIRKLVEDGLFKICPGKHNRRLYTLSSKGMSEKNRLTSAYQSHGFEFYKNSKSKLNHFFNDLSNSGIHHVVFVGVGELAEIAYIAVYETPIKLVAVADDLEVGKKFFDYTIIAIDELKFNPIQKLVITKNHMEKKIIEKILAAGFSEGDIQLFALNESYELI